MALKRTSDADAVSNTESLIALPIAGAILLLFVRGDEEESAPIVAQDGADRLAARVRRDDAAVEPLQPGSADFQFVERHAWIPAFGIDYVVGVDGISLLLLVLTGFLTPLALLSSWESVHKKTKAFSMFLLLLESAMIGVFVSLDLFLFYIFWDAMLVPMYFLIGIWGYERRIYAAIKFILYTMAGSVLMLLAILGLAYLHSTDDRQLQLRSAEAVRRCRCRRTCSSGSSSRSRWRSRSRCRCFRSTPGCRTRTSRRRPPGSVILAGVLLKMGTYGLVRFAFPLFPQAAASSRRISRCSPSSASSTARSSRWCSRT